MQRRTWLLIICMLVVAVAALVMAGVASGRVQFVGSLDSSTCYRVSVYGPATQSAPGTFHGTHFIVTAPPGWLPYPARLLSPGTELVLKQPPLGVSNPIMIVSAQDAPTDLPVQAYVDIVHGQDANGHRYTRLGHVHGMTVAGESGEYYRWTEGNGTTGVRLYLIRHGVVYEIECAAPPGQAAGPALSGWSQVVASWKWDDLR